MLSIWLLVVTAGARATDIEVDKPKRTALGEVPWQARTLPVQPKVIYGTDDRIDLYQETDPERRRWAASTCGLFARSNVQENLDGDFTIRTFGYSVCADEPFSNQPTSAFCSGFMVGPDLIATAGHCFDNSDIGSARFVFGFVMTDASTPVVTVDASQVYTGVELVGHALSGNLDYSVVRVDRVITAPEAEAFDLRRTGVVPIGAPVGVIGHPSGLPLKLAFGDATVVRTNDNAGFFVANLDTYGGNSGSPVIDPNTGVVEGILVRGETDFVTIGGCSRSNVVSNTGGRGEDVSKTSTFIQFVPELGSFITLDQTTYPCGGMLEVTVEDHDLAGTASVVVDLETSGGDMESFALEAIGASGRFAGAVVFVEGDVLTDNGQLEVGPGTIITAAYTDEVHGAGAPDLLTASASVDCTAPSVDNVSVGLVGTESAIITFTTDEPASGQVRFGVACHNDAGQSSFVSRMNHTVTLQGLEPATQYFFYVAAADPAGNDSVADNEGACFSFVTAEGADYVTEYFPATVPDLVGSTLTYTPTESGTAYSVCRTTTGALPISTSAATVLNLTDDGSLQVPLDNGASVPFFGTSYGEIIVNANGNITFDAISSNFIPDPTVHFIQRRISACFADLNPASGGRVTSIQAADSIVITWEDVPHFDLGGFNTIQVSLGFDGVIRMTFLRLSAAPAVVGLSNGLGLPSDFASANLNRSVSCGPADEVFHSADSNRDRMIELTELMRVIQFVNLDGYHCDENGEDGYGAGPGVENCPPHNSDYSPQDWDVSLTEVLRLVQFFNVGGYTVGEAPSSEDGFEPLALP